MRINFRILLVFLLTTFFSCSEDCSEDCISLKLDCDCCPHYDSVIVKSEKSIIDTVNVFIETSGSMKGFMVHKEDKPTEFQKVIGDLILRLKGEYPNTFVFSIYDSKSQFVEVSVDSIVKNLAKGKFDWSGTTELPVMIERISKYISENSVNVFVSDLVYFPEDDEDETSVIGRMRESYKDVAEKYASSVFCLRSEFIDDSNNKADSPYYILVQGNSKNINYVKEKLKQTTTTFGEEFYEAAFDRKLSHPFYSILAYSGNSSNFEPIFCKDQGSFLGIKEVEAGDEVSFSVCLNLAAFPSYVSSASYLDSNKLLTSDGLEVLKQKFVSKDSVSFIVRKDDQKVFDLSTHLAQISVKMNRPGAGVLNLSMRNMLPSWIENMNTSNRNDIEKTYGLSNFFSSVSQAYNSKNSGMFLFKDLSISIISK